MNYLIVSHGRYAQGIANAASKLIGDKGMNVVCAYLDETPINELLQNVFAGKENDEWIVFTDILGGSVNQEMIKGYMSDHVHVIAGVNLDTVIRLIQIDEVHNVQKQIHEVLSESRERMVFVNEVIEID